MNFLPIVERELRLRARARSTYRVRVLSVLMVVVISLGMLYAGFGGALSAASAGRNLFLILSSVAGAYVLLEGALSTADCLSREKREGTLGLLFLTRLRGYDVVAGKFLSRTAGSAYGLIAALPALGIALFLGGVTGQELCRMMLALVNGLFFSASFGMLISAISRRERSALSAAMSGVLGVTTVLPMVGWAIRSYQGMAVLPPSFLVFSPAGAFWHVLDSGAGGGALGYSFSAALGWSHLLGWTFLLLASAVLPYCWREGRAPSGPTHPPARARLDPSQIRFRKRSKRDWLEDNPIIWAGNRSSERNWWIWLLPVVGASAGTVGWLCLGYRWLNVPAYALIVTGLHVALIYSVALLACRGPIDDQRSGVLEILLTTPMGDDVYRRGRMLLVKRRSLWPLLLVLMADFGLMAAGCWSEGSISWEWFAWIGCFTILAVKLLIDLYTLSWVGFWQGLRTASTGRALRNTVFYVFIVKWLVLLGCLAFLGILTRGQIFQSPAGAVIGAAGYVILFVMGTLHFCGLAIGELQDDLRWLALGVGSRPVPGARFR